MPLEDNEYDTNVLDNELRESSRRLVPLEEDGLPSPEVKRQQTPAERRRFIKRRVGAATLVAVSVASSAAIVSAAPGIVSAAQGIVEQSHSNEFSEDTETWTARQGQGIETAAQNINGIENVDIRDAVAHIESHPENAEELQDGVLQVNEQLEIPVSVVGYEETK